MNPHVRPSRWVGAILATVVLMSLATQARAHFLFIRIDA